jgi:hypothetical protein
VAVAKGLADAAGVGLVATAATAAGALLFEERPLACVPAWECAAAACHHCVGPTSGAGCACDGCGARFCGVGCRAEADAAYHAQLCDGGGAGGSGPWARFTAHAEGAANEYYVLAARVIAIWAGGGSGGGGGGPCQPCGAAVFPWRAFKGAPFWETLALPDYGDVEGEGEGGEKEEEEGEEDEDDYADGGGEGEGEDDEEADGEAYVCEHGCGFEGPFGAVAAHEVVCVRETAGRVRAAFDVAVADQVAESLALLAAALPAAAALGAAEYGWLLGMLRMNVLGVVVPTAEEPEPEAMTGVEAEAEIGPQVAEGGAGQRAGGGASGPSSPASPASPASPPPPPPPPGGAISGFGIFALHSCLNHATDPARANAEVLAATAQAAATVVVRATRALGAGEELLVDYLPGEEPAERRRTLWQQYRIDAS